MRKTALILVCLLLLLCGCEAKEQKDMENKNQPTVTLVNGVQEADIWILPMTAENLKTTVWGAATAPKVKTGESAEAPLCAPGEDGLYLLRMIDTDGFYYSADGVELQAGWTVRISEDAFHAVTAEVTDADGALMHAYDVFAAKL